MDLRLIHQIRAKNLIDDFTGPAITADAVLNGIDQGESRHWTPADFPCLAPPFPDFFVEGRSQAVSTYQMGMRVTDTARWLPIEEPFHGLKPKPETAYRLVFQAFSSLRLDVFVHPGLVVCHIDREGHLLDDMDAQTVAVDGPLARKMNDAEWCFAHGYLPTADAMNALPLTYMAIALLHCKNIERQDQHLPRQPRRQYERKYGVLPDVTYTLSIRGSGGAGGEGSREAMGLLREHIRRGHFKTYSEDAPLFGKHTGTYFWPQGMRGNPKRGKVEKDYAISETLVEGEFADDP